MGDVEGARRPFLPETSIVTIFCHLELLDFFTLFPTGVQIFSLTLADGWPPSLSFFCIPGLSTGSLSPGKHALTKWDRSCPLLSRVSIQRDSHGHLIWST